MTKLIAIPTRDGMVDDHFGHCAYYSIVTLDEQNQVVKQERLDSPEGCGCKSNIASVMQEMGITLMLAGNMGMGAYNKLSAHGITVVRGCHGTIEDVLQAYLNGELKDSLEACNHHDCNNHEEKPVYVMPTLGK
ncbi:NifB/NifX family molybdenum-iron cluster-binding protein [Prevotella sp. E13-17]|uniref:NifB/NifX family molybdenum-iron cluster-binding protein n=1 Tax=Prevotella sp. E13-17 TaxID=2913616 RepID=UPI001EDB563F|nr:NifB/NifX family molybdenum-iron cluster-binding protein [Prevotella sp. E13-17]UKK50610.1 NifB/NifX family molybdenum-iron cluster-binding protein [Prevotella sp. E13-17]